MNTVTILIVTLLFAVGIYVGTFLTDDSPEEVSLSVDEGEMLSPSRKENDTRSEGDSAREQEAVPSVPTYGRVINMSNSGLTSVPGNVFKNTDAVELNLSGNALTGALPAEVRQMSNLRILNLENNNFTGIPAEVGQLSKLEVLDVSGNPITGLPNEIGNLSHLKVFDLTGTEYSRQDLEGIKKRLPASTVIKTDS